MPAPTAPTVPAIGTMTANIMASTEKLFFNPHRFPESLVTELALKELTCPILRKNTHLPYRMANFLSNSIPATQTTNSLMTSTRNTV